MTSVALNGTLGFGPQPQKGLLAHEADAPVMYRHRATDIDLSAIDDQRIGPQEVGGIAVPTFPYKAGQMSAGGFTVFPRLANYFGWLLYAGLGTKAAGVGHPGVAGMYDHAFKFYTTEGYETKIPWNTFYKYIPGDMSAETPTDSDLYEIYKDCKVLGLNFTLPNDGPISARVDVMGRSWVLSDTAPMAWSNTFEDYQSIPIGCHTGGHIKIPEFSANALPIVQATVGLQNTPLDIRQEKVYGSPELDDITIVSRQLTVDLVVKWNDPQLYRKIYTGSVSGTEWAERPFVQDLEIVAHSNDYATGTTPYQLKVEAPSIVYQVQGGVRLAGPNAVMMRLTGTALAPSAGDYCTFTLSNLQSEYTWPAAQLPSSSVSSSASPSLSPSSSVSASPSPSEG
jgi:hypothetical protein